MYFLNLHGLAGVIASATIVVLGYWLFHALGFKSSDTIDGLALISFCQLATLYALTFDRNDVQGIQSFDVNMRNEWFSYWASKGITWATDPMKTGVVLHPGRRLSWFIYPLVLNMFLPLPISLLAWSHHIHNAETVVHWPYLMFIAASVAVIVSSFTYARLTRAIRLIPPLPKIPW